MGKSVIGIGYAKPDPLHGPDLVTQNSQGQGAQETSPVKRGRDENASSGTRPVPLAWYDQRCQKDGLVLQRL